VNIAIGICSIVHALPAGRVHSAFSAALAWLLLQYCNFIRLAVGGYVITDHVISLTV